MGTGNPFAHARRAYGARLMRRIGAVTGMTVAALAVGWAAQAAPSFAYATHTGAVVFDDNSNVTIDPDPFGVGEGNTAANAFDNVELGANGMRHITTGSGNVASGISALESRHERQRQRRDAVRGAGVKHHWHETMSPPARRP